MRVVVIGAGPAGLTAAYELCKRGVHVDVFEASAAIGGLARSLVLWGRTVELGSHIFISHDPRVSVIWSELVGDAYSVLTLRRGIYKPGQVYSYPLALGDAMRKLGVFESLRCAASLVLGRVWRSSTGAESAEAWIVARFGRRLFELFFRDYAEKLWGLPASEVDERFAMDLLGNLDRLSPWKYLTRRVTQAHAAAPDLEGPRFSHPKEGLGFLWTQMAGRVRAYHGRLHLRTRVQQLLTSDHQVLGVVAADKTWPCDVVVSSMPLPLLVRALPPCPSEVQAAVASLTFRNTILVYLRVESSSLFPYNWLYVYSSAVGIGRITNFRQWAEGEPPTDASILCLEYWCSDSDALWQAADASVVEIALREVRTVGLLGGARVSGEAVYRIRASHPVYHKGYLDNVRRLRDYVQTFNGLVTIGRHGAFSFNSVSDSILEGVLAAERAVAADPCVAR